MTLILTIVNGHWLAGDDPEIDKIDWVTGTQAILKNSIPSVIMINKVIKPVPMKFEEIQGEMMTGYQELLEREWIRQLKQKYTVKTDSMVLEEVKKKLNHE